MITKNDCLSILVRLGDNGIDTNAQIKKLLVSKEISLEVLKFISAHRGIEVANFYELIRKNHNKHKSPLYTNIVRDIEDETEIVTTLTCLLTQIMLYSKKLDSAETFFKEVRAEEISGVLNNFFKEGNVDDCLKMLRAIKSDLLVLEYIAGRRDLVQNV